MAGTYRNERTVQNFRVNLIGDGNFPDWGRVGKPYYTISNPGWVLGQIRKIGSEWAAEMGQNIRNSYQMEGNKAAPSAPPKIRPRGRRFAPALGFCCLLFGKDVLCLASFPEPILGLFSEFVPNLARDLSRISNSIKGFSYLSVPVNTESLLWQGPSKLFDL